MKLRTIATTAFAFITLSAAPILACNLQTGTPYEIQGAGTGSVGPYVNGHVEFDGDMNGGPINGTLYGHWYGHGECVIDWAGTYTNVGTVLGGLTYDADVVATGPCLPKEGVKTKLILIPSNEGNHFGWGTYNATSNTHGDGNIQD